MRELLTMLLTVMLLAAGSAHAQLRTVPANAKPAKVGAQRLPLPYVDLGQKTPLKLAPGGVIFDENNRYILHEALPPGAAVAYTLDMNGDVARIYILTPQEQAQVKKP